MPNRGKHKNIRISRDYGREFESQKEQTNKILRGKQDLATIFLRQVRMLYAFGTSEAGQRIFTALSLVWVSGYLGLWAITRHWFPLTVSCFGFLALVAHYVCQGYEPNKLTISVRFQTLRQAKPEWTFLLPESIREEVEGDILQKKKAMIDAGQANWFVSLCCNFEFFVAVVRLTLPTILKIMMAWRGKAG